MSSERNKVADAIPLELPAVLSDAARSSSTDRDTNMRESFAYMVGPAACGKSQLLAHALQFEDTRRAFCAVHYSCARKRNTSGYLDNAHIWELPGTQSLASAMASKSKVCG